MNNILQGTYQFENTSIDRRNFHKIAHNGNSILEREPLKLIMQR